MARKHFENFNEIRNQINLQKTKLKIRIDEIASKMIEKVNRYENLFKNNTNSFLISSIKNAQEFKEIKTVLDEEFRYLKINTEKIQKLIDQYKNESSQFFSDNTIQMENNFLIHFKPNINFKPEIFGELQENSNEKIKMDSSSYLSLVNINNNEKSLNIINNRINNVEQEILKNSLNNKIKSPKLQIDYSNHLIRYLLNFFVIKQ